MNRDDMNRWEAEIEGWRQRYEALLKTLADHQSIAPPMMLADKQSYELGLLHGAAAEREACAKVCDEVGGRDSDTHAWDAADAIRARGEVERLQQGKRAIADYVKEQYPTRESLEVKHVVPIPQEQASKEYK